MNQCHCTHCQCCCRCCQPQTEEQRQAEIRRGLEEIYAAISRAASESGKSAPAGVP